jgi:hypothetical protein
MCQGWPRTGTGVVMGERRSTRDELPAMVGMRSRSDADARWRSRYRRTAGAYDILTPVLILTHLLGGVEDALLAGRLELAASDVPVWS